MPIIATIGRSHWKVRLLIGGIYAVLLTGGLSMIYPLLLMLAGSTKSGADLRELSIVPRFLYDDGALYRKHIEGLFNESVTDMQMTYDVDAAGFENLEVPRMAPSNAKLVEQWQRFLNVADGPGWSSLGYLDAPVSRTLPSQLREFKAEIARRFGSDIDHVNSELGTEFVNWNAFQLTPERYLSRVQRSLPDSRLVLALQAFKSRQPTSARYYFSVEGFYKILFLKTQYTRDIAAYNIAHDTEYPSYADVRLSRKYPRDAPTRVRGDWEQFVRSTIGAHWLRASCDAAPFYRAYLVAKYAGRIEALNASYGTSHASFDDVPFPEFLREHTGMVGTDWEAFLEGWKDPATRTLHAMPIEMLSIESVEHLFRDHLHRTFGTIDAMNAAIGSRFRSFDEVNPPQREAHWLEFQRTRAALRWELATRNFRAVWDYMVLRGRGIINTVIYCVLAVLCALTFNPLAAYALSRYRLPSTYKILLFLMLTMAFPAMVTQIPVFLMLRKLGLLNTFAALVLPGLVSGYSIFLLKGFFDSLPRELFESAALDGAGEWTIFWHITMALSKPILAVIALGAFAAAYANFMFALLVCQNESMWTLMVWLYQLQQRAGPGVVYSALALSSVPTIAVFVIAQNFIMRGIVVPVEK